ncbi:sperm flagellar protein 2-like [Pocillopora damicornis]|uniref:sperm flagellar protein 2-like n=1 Tax=Pocillopora damicornis TaxID=46731 RepID=UPI000F551118|nr:sperm flagellar protein 2-like [Pocillopora damicornis]
MTDILCRWLNEDVKLSRIIDPINIAKEFSTGFLLGELLNKHGLQEDFSFFSQNITSDSKLHNFTRLEPTLKLLEVPFDTNVAQAIMSENHSAITRLMYQLFIALGKKSKMGLTGVAMETMRPSGPVKLESIESGLYKERLKQLTKRQVDLNFEQLVQRYQAKQKQQEDLAFKAKFEEEERMRKYLQGQRRQGLDKSKQAKQKQLEMMGKIRDATVRIPKPPDSKKTAKSRTEIRRQREAEEVKESIDAFEASMRAVIPPASPIGFEGESNREIDTEIDTFLGTQSPKKPVDPLSYIKPRSNDDYINKIRTRLEENSVARKEREKRRRRVLIEQMKAHEAQEEAHREEMLVNRLMRQSQQERRIAVQLMQIRHEKEVIRQNRIFREKQYAERRLKDFDDALTREAELCRQARIEYAEETRKAQELNDKVKAEIAEAKYQKHYNICREVLSQIVDFSCKIGEYRELTEKLIPPKMFREWKALFFEGLPIYEDQPTEESSTELSKQKEIEKEKEDLMDEGDFLEYKNLIGEWTPVEGSEIQGPAKDNAVLGHIIHRLFNIVSPPEAPPPPPEFPPFPIKVCFLGKFFSGKTTTINKILEGHRMVRLSVDDLVAEAINAFKNNECIEEPSEETAILDEGTSTKKVSIHEETGKSKDQASEESRAVTPQSGAPEETMGEGRENEDPNKVEEKQVSEAVDVEEKRDKTKEELEKEMTDIKDDDQKSPSKSKVLEPVLSRTKGPTLTVRAKLGSKAYSFLKKGKTTPDQLLVDIMVEAVRQVPEGSGWIMDGFPSTINQAKLLEKSLSGYDAQKEAKDAKAAKEPSKVSKTRKSRLAPDPHPSPEAPAPKSGIDLVLLFDLPDEVSLKRAEGRMYDPMSSQQYHQEYNPPVEGSYTGINKHEKVIPITDPSNDREQVQQRIVGFGDGWPKLEKWFAKFGVLQRVDANSSQDELYDEVSALLNETYQKLIAPPEELPSEPSVHQGQAAEAETPSGAQVPAGDGPSGEGLGSEGVTAPPESVAPPSEAPSEVGAKSDGKSEKGTSKNKADSKPGSPKSRKSKKDRSPSPPTSKKGTKSRTPSPPSSKKGSRSGSKSPSASKKGSRPGSKGSRPGSKRAKSAKKGAEEPEEEIPPEPQGPPEPEPGSEDWEYVDQAIDVDFAGVLVSQWESTEEVYVESCKNVFGLIRRERELIHRYFYGVRKDFVAFLKRPDEKQEYVLQWQKSYNEVTEDMRGDEDTKAELHQQLDDLCDRLNDICDNRKDLAEKERQSVMNEGWLEDRLGLLTNFYITLMQAEVDRYQDTVRLLRDYYVGMEGKIPSEVITDYARLSLVELPLTVRPQSASSKSGGSESVTNLAATEKTEVKSPSGKKDRDKSSKTPEPSEAPEEEQKPRIPLVPRRPKSGEPGTGKGKDKKSDKKKDKTADPDKPDTPVPPSDPDEKLVFDAFIMALTIIDTLALIDQTEQEAEAIRQAELEKEKEKEALQKKAKDKKDKKGRKSPGKGGSPSKTETPPPPPPEDQEGQSEEEKLKQKTKERARKEFLGAVGSEDNGLKTRLEMIKNHAIAVLQELKGKADSTYKDMDDWLGERFLQEVGSIKEMAENIRFAVEKEEKLQEESLLMDKDFVVDLDTKTFKTPTPPPPPSPTEVPQSDTFTVNQLLNLHRQMLETAPSGVISNRAFCDTIMDMTALTHGMELLPDSWMNITQQQLQEVCSLLALDTEFIDWRRFLLAAAQPWPPASKMDLLLTLEHCREVDTTLSGSLTQQRFEQVGLWFSGQQELENPQDPDESPAFDRLGKLKNAFYQIFADHNNGVHTVDYLDMLLYFAVDPDPLEGFLRGLSLVANQPMPSSKSLVHLPQPMTEEYGGDVSVPQIQEPTSPPPEMNSLVTLDNLMKVFHHGEGQREDTYRLNVTADPDDTFAKERLAGVFVELGAEETEAVPFHLLYQHPIIQDCMHMCQRFKTLDLRNSFKSSSVDTFE